MPGTSPASRDRARVVDRALAEARTGYGRNRDAAQQQIPPSHGNPPRSERVPNTNTSARP